MRGSSNDGVRRHNLSAIVGLLHRGGPASRAELTRATGLNRSTIGALVGELVELGLVDETEPGATKQAGRPSPVIVAREDVVAVAVNPEVDAVTIALVALSGRVLARVRHATTGVPTPGEVVGIVVAGLAELQAELPAPPRIVGVGVAVPGLVRTADGMVVLAPHLGWREVPIAEMLAEALQLPVIAANDAAAGEIAESQTGAGRGASQLIYLNGGASGIGGGILVNGELFGGASGHAGEFGHTLVNSLGMPCHCGANGCLETEVRRAPLLALLGLENADGEQLERLLLAELKRAGERDSPVAALIRQQQGYLAVALRNIVNAINPELIVLGGYLGTLLAAAPDHLIRGVLEGALPGSRDAVRVVRAELGENLLLIGAATLAFRPILHDPAGVVPARA